MARFFALLPGGYPDVKDDYAECESITEALEVLEEAAPFLAHPAIHVFDGGREPWNEDSPYPDQVAEIDENGVTQVQPA